MASVSMIDSEDELKEVILLECDRLNNMTSRFLNMFGLGDEREEWAPRFSLTAEVAIESAREDTRQDLLAWREDIRGAIFRGEIVADPYHMLDEQFRKAHDLANRIELLQYRFTNYAAGLEAYMRPSDASRLQNALPLLEESYAFLDVRTFHLRRAMRDSRACLKTLLSIEGLDICCARLAGQTFSYESIMDMVGPHFRSLASMAVDRDIVLASLTSGGRIMEHIAGIRDQHPRATLSYVLNQEPAVRNTLSSLARVVMAVETLRSTLPGNDNRHISLQDVESAFQTSEAIWSVAATIINIGEPLENILQYYVTQFTELYHRVYG